MKSVFHKLFVLCCALYLSGAHWMVLQVGAWTGMVVARSQRASIAEAVETTFDGQHPCRACSVIASGQKEEQRKRHDGPVLKQARELKLVVVECYELPARVVSGEELWPAFVAAGSWRTEAPPTPPPLA